MAVNRLGAAETVDPLHAIFSKAQVSWYPAKTIICSEDDSATHIFLIEEGSVALTKSSADGREMILAFRTKHSIIATEAAILGRQYTNSVVTVSRSRVRALPSEVLRRAVQEGGALSGSLHRSHCKEIEELRNRISGLAFDSPRERLEDFFLNLQAEAPRPHMQVRLPCTQGELARYINVSRQRLNGLLRKLEKDGIVRRLKGSYVVDPKGCSSP